MGNKDRGARGGSTAGDLGSEGIRRLGDDGEDAGTLWEKRHTNAQVQVQTLP